MMETGMLWFDNDGQRDLSGRVRRAAEHYRRKYGEAPSLCFVHPSMVGSPGEPVRIMDLNVEVRAARWMLPNHFWIGLRRAGDS